ncbi:MAG: VOC family protein [bacterium]|nr:VOC family protein [bacterium]
MHFRLDSLRIFTRDWERALAFYSETLGMPVQ